MSGATPVGFGASFVEELRLIARRNWLSWTLLTTLTALVAALVAGPFGNSGWPFGTTILASSTEPLVVLVTVSWALTIWRDDPPSERAYFWLQPIGRDAHALARIAAGAVLLAASLLVAAITFAIALAVVEPPAVSMAEQMHVATTGGFGSHPAYWLMWILAVLLTYLIAACAALLSERPAVVIVGGAFVVLMLAFVANVRDWDWLRAVVQVFYGGSYSLSAALAAPTHYAGNALRELTDGAGGGQHIPMMPDGPPRHPVAAMAIWITAAAAALVASLRLSRPR